MIQKYMDERQACFWTERWQQGEKKAEEDILNGCVHNFADAESAVSLIHTKAGIKKFKGKRNFNFP